LAAEAPEARHRDGSEHAEHRLRHRVVQIREAEALAQAVRPPQQERGADVGKDEVGADGGVVHEQARIAVKLALAQEPEQQGKRCEEDPGGGRARLADTGVQCPDSADQEISREAPTERQQGCRERGRGRAGQVLPQVEGPCVLEERDEPELDGHERHAAGAADPEGGVPVRSAPGDRGLLVIRIRQFDRPPARGRAPRGRREAYGIAVRSGSDSALTSRGWST
jgi:hypothetical protein